MKHFNSMRKGSLKLMTLFLAGLFFTFMSPNQAQAQADCYSFSQRVDTYVPIVGGTEIGSNGTLYRERRTLPFAFDYMNQTGVTDIWYCRYGYIQLQNNFGGSTNVLNWTSTNANNVICAFNNYLYGNQGAGADPGVYEKTIGTAPNRVYIIEWKDMRYFTQTNQNKYNFQIHLFEGSNAIEFHYGSFVTTRSFSVGVGLRGNNVNDYFTRELSGNWLQSTEATGTGQRVQFNANSLPASGLVYRFERFEQVTAAFTAPNQAFVDALVTYTSGNPGFNIEWDKLDDDVVESTNDSYTTTYSTAGTYTMEMIAYNCLVADTVKKDITIVNPTSAPVADFIAFDNDILIYENIDLFDLSTQGPNFWDWLVYDSADSLNTVTQITGNDPFSDATPSVITLSDGNYTVCLRTGNSLGFSSQVCKYDYITVHPVNIIAMGPIKKSDATTGTLTDNGGVDFNYSNGRFDDFVISTCNADSIILTFNHFKVADDNDRLLVFDGPNASGKPLHPGTQGFNKSNPPPEQLVATSGAMFFFFITNGSGTDSGFSATWNTIVGPPVAPATSFTHADTIYTGVPSTITNTTFARGEVFHEWTVQGDPMTYIDADLEDYVFATSGLRNVCLKDSTCVGVDQYCKDVFVFTPNAPIDLDFDAYPRRVKTNVDVVDLWAISDQANMYEWSFFPESVDIDSGDVNSKRLKIKLTEAGPYTITLKAWNSVGGQLATQKITLKDDYVIAVEYCLPSVQITSSDIGIERVLLRNTANPPATLIDNESEVGVSGYTDYTEDIEVPAASLYFGVDYDLSVRRATPAVNPINRKAWIDFNIDGEFDNTEAVLTEGTGNAVQKTERFTVPTLDNAFAGPTRLRVSALYNNQVNEACGTGNGGNPVVGEFEDYGINLEIDPDIPVITLNGNDTVFVEVNKSYTEQGATVLDPSQGDISGNLRISGEVDTAQTGIYRLYYSAKDASGNPAEQVLRVIYVVVDNTAPEITDGGDGDTTIEVFTNYVDLGVTAFDSKDGNLNTAIKMTSNLDVTKLGVYQVTYTVADNQGNTAVFVRNVTVVDTEKPVILALGSDNVQVGTSFVDMTTVTDNYDQNITLNVTGEIVNPNVIGEYQVTYTATDGSGNVADILVRTYKVDDLVAPSFRLSSTETIMHDVRTPFDDPTVVEGLVENYYPLSQVKVSFDYSNLDVNTLGTYTMSVTASDPSGNTTTITREVMVVDRKAPILFGAYDLEVALYDTTVWVFEGIKVEDNYDPPSVLLPRIQVIDHNINVFKEGLYHATFRVTDLSGNVSVPVTRMVKVCATCKTTTSTDDIFTSLKVYPNPSSGIVNVEFTLSKTDDVEVTVKNVNGQVISTTTAENNINGTVKLDLSNQPNGVYFVVVRSGNAVEYKKVIITK